MPDGIRELYNEGRVTGFSAYEIYVRHHVADDPDIPPASEKEWLSSTIAMGSSMLLKVPANADHEDNEYWMYEVQLPSTSRLGAANTIIGSFFLGDAVYSGQWATKITDYGYLISNNTSASPNGTVSSSGNIPTQNIGGGWSEAQINQLKQYMKIVDGIVIQPGNWFTNTSAPPQKSFAPDLGDYPRVRIQIKGKVEVDFPILLTGFTIREVLRGTSGLDNSTTTLSPQDGDFLGPAVFPWSAKIVFSVPSSYVSFFESNKYRRELPSGSTMTSVDDTAVIDMKATNPGTYYESNYPGARVEINVGEHNSLGDGTAVLTIYQKSLKYPPALWGTYADEDGVNYLNPIDVVAPGTVKMFEDATEEELKDYEDTFEGTFGINKDSETGTIEIIGPDGTLVPAADVSLRNLVYTSLVSSDQQAQAVVTQTGNKTTLSISASSDTNGTQYTIGSDSTSTQTVGNTSFDVGNQTKLTPNTSNINWVALLEALANNKSIDILGNNMKALKAGLAATEFPYIQLPNGLRLYISSTEPTPNASIPVGSIGIGWFDESEEGD